MLRYFTPQTKRKKKGFETQATGLVGDRNVPNDLPKAVQGIDASAPTQKAKTLVCSWSGSNQKQK